MQSTRPIEQPRQDPSGERRGRRSQAGTGTVELVGLVVAVAVLLAAVGSRLASSDAGSHMGAAVGAVLESAVRGGGNMQGGGALRGRVRGDGASGWSADGARWTTGGNVRTDHVQVGGDPSLGPAAGRRVRHVVATPGSLEVRAAGGGWTWRDRSGSIRQSASATWCGACIGGSVGWNPSLGGRADARGVRDGAHDGLSIDASAGVHAALVRAQAVYAARTGIAGLALTMQTTGRLVVGADADGSATFQLGMRDQHVAATGSAVAGARLRGEQQASAHFAGLAIDAVGGAEGWAGAGGTGAFELGHDGGKVEVGGRLGGALGLGGALDGHVVVDVSGLLAGAGSLLRLGPGHPGDHPRPRTRTEHR